MTGSKRITSDNCNCNRNIWTTDTATIQKCSSHHRKLHSKWMLTVFVVGFIFAGVNAAEETEATKVKTFQPSPSSPSPKSVTDEIYIDDEGIEGSAGHDELDDDLEKEPDYSGSGFGPDDEDSSIDHDHHRITHKKHKPVPSYPARGGGGSDIPDSGIGSSSTTQTGSTIESETNINKDIVPKANNDFGLNFEHTTYKQIPVDTNSNFGAGIGGNEVFIMNTKNEDRTVSFFAQPGILAAVIGGTVVGLLCAILIVMFIVYRMRKKDEGSYILEETKQTPADNSYAKNANNREFFA